MSGSAIITGAGPGVSGSFARLLAAEGYPVGLLGVDHEQVEALADELRTGGTTVATSYADLTDVDAATAAVRELAERLGGRVDVLHFNPSAFREKDLLELTVAELLDDVALGVGALLTVVQAARPFLATGSRVTVTGSMAADQPWHRAASLGVQKAGVRKPRAQPRRGARRGRRAGGVGDGARHPGARGRLHAGQGRRSAARRDAPAGGRVAHRGALRGLSRDVALAS